MTIKLSRRTALSSLATLGVWTSGAKLLSAQESEAPRLLGEPPGRIAPLGELVNVFEVEAMAERKLSSAVFSTIAGGDRRAFEKMWFRPRRFINAQPLDLTAEVLGEKLFAPILVGPIARLGTFFPEGEVALVRGASAARTPVVISDRSSEPLERIVGEAKTSSWYQIYPEADMAPALKRVQRAVAAGCKVIVVTVGTPYRPAGSDGAPDPGKLVPEGNAHLSWGLIDQVRQAAKRPVVLKGIMDPDEARRAVQQGIDGIIVSNHGGTFVPGLASPMDVLTSIVDAVGGKIPVLVDGGFRRGGDVVKALALGARAVLVARPVVWGLAAYGSDGVSAVLEMMQSEVARAMSACSRPALALLDRSMIHVDKR